MNRYIYICDGLDKKVCQWTNVNELLAGAGNTMSFEDANLLLSQFYIVIGVAFVVKLIIKSLIYS